MKAADFANQVPYKENPLFQITELKPLFVESSQDLPQGVHLVFMLIRFKHDLQV